MRAALKSRTNLGAWLGVSQASLPGSPAVDGAAGSGARRAGTTRNWPKVY